MKNVRSALCVAMAVAVAGSLAACGSDAGDSGTAGTGGSGDSGPQTINFVGADDPHTYEPVITAFEKANPDIKVEYSQIPLNSFTTTMQQRLSAKDETIDVYTVNQPNLAANAAQGFLVDLTELADQVQPVVTKDQYEVNFYDDKMWALPVWTSTLLLFYNKDALAEAGVDAPQADPENPLTWEEIASKGRKVQQKTGIESGFIFGVENYFGFQPLPESLGGGSGITGDDALEVDVTNQGWVEAMQWYSDTFESGLSQRLPELQGQTYFTDGKAAFYVGGPWDVGIFADSEINWGVAPLPKFEAGEHVTPTGSWSWGISPFSDKQEAALKFVEFGSINAKGNLATTESTTIIPSNTEAMESFLSRLEATAGKRSAGVTDIITYAAEHTAVARPTSVGYPQFEQLMNKAFSDIADGADVEERLAKAESEIGEAWDKIR